MSIQLLVPSYLSAEWLSGRVEGGELITNEPFADQGSDQRVYAGELGVPESFSDRYESGRQPVELLSISCVVPRVLHNIKPYTQ
jgi:hypothetical protein